MKWVYLFLVFIFLLSCDHNHKGHDWPVYHGDKAGSHFSILDMIDTSNVHLLKPVWTYNSKDADPKSYSQIQCNPLIIDHTLYGINPGMKLFALDAKTGKEKWVFDPNKKSDDVITNKIGYHILINARGMAYWTDGRDKRLFYTVGSYTYAVNAETGKVITDFGNGGYIDLRENLGRDASSLFVVNTSPGMIYDDLIILGTRVDESPPAAPGHVRAYNVKTGELVWRFNTIPQPGEEGYETWEDTEAYTYIGGANVWSGFTLDEKTGVLYAGTGSASDDFYGGKRLGENLYANCILAIDAATGKKKWHFQTIHHDLWDKDLPTPPTLIEVMRNGKKIEAVAQPTKNGYVFILDRASGRPLFPVDEVAVETNSMLAGEVVHPTQPIPRLPQPIVRTSISHEDVNPYLSQEEQDSLRTLLKSTYRHGNPYLPPGEKPSIVLPGYDGGAEWGGAAYDKEKGVLYINSNEMGWIMEMVPTEPLKDEVLTRHQAGLKRYAKYCEGCHGRDRKGLGNNPSLLQLESRYDVSSISELISTGRRMMPAMPYLSPLEREVIAEYILNIEDDQNTVELKVNEMEKKNHLPYRLKGYKKFLSKEGWPAISPPWGTLTAIDVHEAEFLWQIPLGNYPALEKKGIKGTGAENYGGPVVTSGGLLFIGAAMDGRFRVFNSRTGELLWEYELPAPAYATPAIYESEGKQYVVIACGGGKMGTHSSDAYVCFGLPE